MGAIDEVKRLEREWTKLAGRRAKLIEKRAELDKELAAIEELMSLSSEASAKAKAQLTGGAP